MSSLKNLFNLTSDELFQKYTISEIKCMQNDLQKEIDKKQDELRVLVGEKYRDFIEVADKVDLMNKLAVNITDKIENVAKALTMLNTSFENNSSESQLNKKYILMNENDVAKNTVAVLIKLLIDIGDQIWYKIDEDKFIASTTLLQLAVHIKTVLSLEINWEVDKKFPVVNELWSSLLRFPIILIRIVEEKLKIVDLSLHTACECLVSLTILENLDYINVIKKFLSLRTDSLKHILNSENVTHNVRTHILNSYQIIINTFVILYDSLRSDTGENNGEYWVQIESIVDPNSKPSINLLNFDFSTKYGKMYIPAVIQSFKIITIKSIKPVNSYQHNQCIDEWLSWVKEYSKSQIAVLLNLIGSFNTLNLLKESVTALPKNWSSIMEYFNQNNSLNIWNELYQPLIIERTKILLCDQWNTVFFNIRAEIEILIKHLDDENTKEPENNLHGFLWDSLEDDLLEKITPNSKSLTSTIKSFGLSPNSGKICIFIESLVSDIMNELSTLCPIKDTETEESKILKNHQQLCCLELIERLIMYCHEKSAHDVISENATLFFARFLCGIPYLCTSLNQCILLCDDKGEKWLSINSKLQEENINFWKKWYSNVLSSILSNFNHQMSFLSSGSYRLKMFPKWNVIILEEETKHNDEVTAEIKVPSQASFLVQSLLYSLSSLSSRTLPPRNIMTAMVNDVINEIYKSVESNIEKTSYHQTVYIQLLFDIKYVTSLMVSIENNDLITQSNNTVNKIELKIDPVDLDVISIHIFQNVKQFVGRTQSMFALLINNKARTNVDQYNDSAVDPNVAYNGTTNIPCFPLLPISTVYPRAEKTDFYH